MASAMLLGEVAELCFAAAREADPDGFGLELLSSAKSRRETRLSLTSGSTVLDDDLAALHMPMLASRSIASQASRKRISSQASQTHHLDGKAQPRQSMSGAALALKAQALEAELASFGIVESAATRRAANQWHRVALYDLYLCWCQFTWQASRIRNIDHRHLMFTLACFFTDWRLLIQKRGRYRTYATRLKVRIKELRRSAVLRRWTLPIRSASNASKLKRQLFFAILRKWSSWNASFQIAHRKVQASGRCLLQFSLNAWSIAYRQLESLHRDAQSILTRSSSRRIQREGLLMLRDWMQWQHFKAKCAACCSQVWKRGAMKRALSFLKGRASKLRHLRQRIAAVKRTYLSRAYRHWASAMSIMAKRHKEAEEIIVHFDAQLILASFYAWGRFAVRRTTTRSSGISIQLRRCQRLLEEWAVLPRIIHFRSLQTRKTSASAISFWNYRVACRRQAQAISFNATVFYQRQLADCVVIGWRHKVAQENHRKHECLRAYTLKCLKLCRIAFQAWSYQAGWSQKKRSVLSTVHTKQIKSLTRRFFTSWRNHSLRQKYKVDSLTTRVDENACGHLIASCYAEWYKYAREHVERRALSARARSRIAILMKCHVLDELRNNMKQRQISRAMKRMCIRRWSRNAVSRRCQCQQLLRVVQRQGSIVRKESLQLWHRVASHRVVVRAAVLNLQYQCCGRVARILFFSWLSHLVEQRLHRMATETWTLHMQCCCMEAWSLYINFMAGTCDKAQDLLTKRDRAFYMRCWYEWKLFVFDSWPRPARSPIQNGRAQWSEQAAVEQKRRREARRALSACHWNARSQRFLRQNAVRWAERTTSSTFQAWQEYAVCRSRHDRAINEATLTKYDADTKKAIHTWQSLATQSRQRRQLLQLADEQFNGQLQMVALSTWRLNAALQTRVWQLAQTVLDRDSLSLLRICLSRWMTRIEKQKRLIQSRLYVLHVDEEHNFTKLQDTLHSWRSTTMQLKWVRRKHERLMTARDLAALIVSAWCSRSVKRRIKREHSSRLAKQCYRNAWRHAAHHWQSWAARRSEFKHAIKQICREWSMDAISQCYRAWLLYRVRQHHQCKRAAILARRVMSVKVREALHALHAKALWEKRIRQFAMEGAHKWARSSAHRCCHVLLARVAMRRRQNQIRDRMSMKIKRGVTLSWRYSAARIRGACEIARRRATKRETELIEEIFQAWLAKTAELKSYYEAVRDYASHRLVEKLQELFYMWHLVSQDKRRLFRLTLQVISCVAQKKQKLALRRWHGDVSDRKFAMWSQALEEVRADPHVDVMTGEGVEANNAELPVPIDWLDVDSGLSYEDTDSWDLITNSSGLLARRNSLR